MKLSVSGIGVLLIYFSDKAFWIGASDLAQEGQWRWFLNGEVIPLDSPFWYLNQPQGGDSENCLAISRCNDTACFHDYPCDARGLHFICEKRNATEIPGEATVVG